MEVLIIVNCKEYLPLFIEIVNVCNFDPDCKELPVRQISYWNKRGGEGAANICELHLYDLKSQWEEDPDVVVRISCDSCGGDYNGCNYCVRGTETANYWINELKKLHPILRKQILEAFNES